MSSLHSPAINIILIKKPLLRNISTTPSLKHDLQYAKEKEGIANHHTPGEKEK
jgi:hypothetical protein